MGSTGCYDGESVRFGRYVFDFTGIKSGKRSRTPAWLKRAGDRQREWPAERQEIPTIGEDE